MISGAMVAGIAHNHLGIPLSVAAFAVPAGWYGGVFPDAIEKIGKLYWIEHRTVTHWIPLWLVALFLVAQVEWASLPYGEYSQMIAYGFVAGAMTHLLFDLPNPTGIPLLTPWRRVSLNLWKSGRMDILLTAVWGYLAFTVSSAEWIGGMLDKVA